MKISEYHFLSLLLPLSLGAQTQVPLDPNCCGNDPEGTVLEIRRQASPEAINARRNANASGFLSAGVVKAEEEVPIASGEKSFLGGSEFLVGAKGFTIVPKGSTVTPSRALKVLSEPPTDGNLLSWKDFQLSNPSALRLLPVSEATLNGEAAAVKAITEKIAALKTGGIAYVTSLNGNPVSVAGLSVR